MNAANGADSSTCWLWCQALCRRLPLGCAKLPWTRHTWNHAQAVIYDRDIRILLCTLSHYV